MDLVDRTRRSGRGSYIRSSGIRWKKASAKVAVLLTGTLRALHAWSLLDGDLCQGGGECINAHSCPGMTSWMRGFRCSPDPWHSACTIRRSGGRPHRSTFFVSSRQSALPDGDAAVVNPSASAVTCSKDAEEAYVYMLSADREWSRLCSEVAGHHFTWRHPPLILVRRKWHPASSTKPVWTVALFSHVRAVASRNWLDLSQCRTSSRRGHCVVRHHRTSTPLSQTPPPTPSWSISPHPTTPSNYARSSCPGRPAPHMSCRCAPTPATARSSPA